MATSLVAFELTKRRARRDFVHFFRDFNTSKTRVRMTQSAANCSPQSNSLLNRENTGNFRDLGRPEADLQPKKPCLLYGFHRNSLLNRTGNYFEGTGNFFNGSGNFQDVSGKLRRAVRSEGHVRVWMKVLRGRIAFFLLDIRKSQDAAPARIGDG